MVCLVMLLEVLLKLVLDSRICLVGVVVTGGFVVSELLALGKFSLPELLGVPAFTCATALGI